MFAHLHLRHDQHTDHHTAAVAVAAAGAAVALAFGAARVLQSNDTRAPATLTEQLSPQPATPVPTTVAPAVPPPALPGEAGAVTFAIPEHLRWPIIRVTLVDEAGVEVATQAVVDGSTRFENLSAGTYQLRIEVEAGITEGDGVGVSAARAEQTDPFAVPEGGTLVVTTGP